MAKRISIDTNEIDWLPAAEVFPGYQLEAEDRDAGIFVRVLRRPSDGGGCWQCLLRFVPPSGKGIRITAVAQSDEEVFILDTHRSGSYSCNPAGLRHGQTVTEETTALVHYHGDPDRILKAEVIELVGHS